jgi:hypothetical protein
MRKTIASCARLAAFQAGTICAGLALWAGTARAAQVGFPTETTTTNWVAVAVMGILCFAVYFYFSLCLQVIAKKTSTGNGWLAWIPIANFFLWLKVARRPMWWFILLLIPFVNIIITVIGWMDIAKLRQKAGWWGVMFIIPIMNFVAPGYLAFSA